MQSNNLESPIACPASWPLARLADICKKIGSGATPKGGQSAYQAQRTNFALIRSQNVFDRQFSYDGLAFISDEQASQLKNVWLEKNDVLINITGDGVTFGRVCTVPEEVLPACVNQHVSIIRIDEKKACPGYVSGFLSSKEIKPYIESFNAGGSRRAITKGHIESFVIPLPPYEIQQSIAEFLDVLDDRITLLRASNTTLEAIAQALFKSWFVDFDPVHAKQQGRAPEGMDAQTAALFPDSFEESELGMVPKGWRVAKVSEVADVVKGKSYSSKDLVEGGSTALVTLKSFERGGGFRMDGFKPYIGNYKPSQVVNAGDLIIAYTDVTQAAELIGKPAIVIGVEEYSVLVASLDVGVVRPNSANIGKQFLYGLFKTEDFQSHTLAHTSGTTVLHLAKDGVGSFSFVLPPAELVLAFEKIADAVSERIQTNIDSIRTLASVRDTLLPRLISGKLHLPEAQALVEEAVDA